MTITLNLAVSIPAFVTLHLVQGRCEGVLYNLVTDRWGSKCRTVSTCKPVSIRETRKPLHNPALSHGQHILLALLAVHKTTVHQLYCLLAGLDKRGQFCSPVAPSFFGGLKKFKWLNLLISSEGSGESWPLIVWGHQHVFLVARPSLQDALPNISNS